MKPGDKFKACGERQRYTVMAADERFTIMVKPFNAARTYLYSIADLDRGIRGRCNMIFGPPFPMDTAEGAARTLRLLREGEMEVSHRRNKPLEPEEIVQLNGSTSGA